MKNYIEFFKHNSQLLPIKEINNNEIIFTTNELPFEFYIPEINKYLNYSRKGITYNTDINSTINTHSPEYNSFKTFEQLDKENLYIEFANLLSPKNKKEKLNKLENIKIFIENYGYLFNFSSSELQNEYIVRPLSEIEDEIKIFNVILNMQSILNSDIKTGQLLLPIQNFNMIFKKLSDKILYTSNYDFNKEIKICDDEMLEDIFDIFRNYICSLLNIVITHCEINLCYIFRADSEYSIICNSLLELLYLQFATSVSKSNQYIGTCEYCGKYVAIDNYTRNKKHIYCRLSKEDKLLSSKDRSSCASNAAMAKLRAKKISKK